MVDHTDFEGITGRLRHDPVSQDRVADYDLYNIIEDPSAPGTFTTVRLGLLPDATSTAVRLDTGKTMYWVGNSPTIPEDGLSATGKECAPGTEPGPIVACIDCTPGKFKPNMNNSACQPCPPGSFQPAHGALECILCPSGTILPTMGSAIAQCISCPRHTHNTVGAASCDICSIGRYRDSALVPASTAACKECPPDVTCELNTTLQTWHLKRATFRLSPHSQDLRACSQKDDWTPCRGGRDAGVAGDGYCEDGHQGPLCSICSQPEMYFSESDARCIHCPSASRPTLVGITLALVAAAVAIGLSCAPRCLSKGPQRHWQLRLWQMVDLIRATGWGGKLRILISWYQSVSVIDTIYGVQLPRLYTDWMGTFDFLNFNWLSGFLPAECIGSFTRRMQLSALAPLVLIAPVQGWHPYCRRLVCHVGLPSPCLPLCPVCQSKRLPDVGLRAVRVQRSARAILHARLP